MSKLGGQSSERQIDFGALAPNGMQRDADAGARDAGTTWLRGVITPLAAAAMYFLAAKLGEWLAFPSAPLSAFWAPNAILLAALILAPRERWWIYLLAVVPFHFGAQLLGSPLSQVVVQYVLNSAEALLGAWALQRFCAQPRCFYRARSAVVLIVFGALIAPLVTSVLMAWAFSVLGLTDDLWLMITARTITNAFAVITLVPLIVHGVARIRAGRTSVALARAAEATVLTLCLAVVGFLVFGYPATTPDEVPALLYAPLPFLIWAAMRFGTVGACGTALLVGALSTWGVLNGHGPFTAHDPVNNALSVVIFQVTIAGALLILSSLLEERKLTARSLSASEARFRTMFEHNIIPTVIWRDDFRMCEANDAFQRLTGFSNADFAYGGARWAEFTAWCRELDHIEQLHRTSPDRCHTTEKELLLRDGRRVPVIVARCHFSGEPGGAMYALDLSEFRQAEAGRQMAEGLHSAVLASLHDQIAILDSTGMVIEINESWRRYVETTHPSRFDCVLAGENFLASCARAAQAGDLSGAEELEAVRAVLDRSELRRQLELSDASAAGPRWLEVSIEQLRRQAGGAVITRTDVTARKQAEAEAHNQRQQLTHLGRAAVLGELSGAFAHELNQPLTSIMGNAEAGLRLLARDAGHPTQIKAILTDIVQDDERAAQVIQRLRALLRKGELQRQPLKLNAVIDEVLQLVRSEIIARKVSVTTNLDAYIPLVMADRVQVQQVVLNLLMNACEAMADMPAPDRRLSLSTRFIAQDECIELTIKDSGSGIAAGELERIFQPFVTTKSEGMGLGLAICRSVAEAHQGRLWAENAAHGGAIFRLRLPVEGGGLQ
jgi:PAS domain S-box-containing protein